ncbi:MAG: hypothetical protein KY445_08780 [Armatimonadetes bacterium]|nr:hypothetical protein [Armatimonadota bacterium]
MKPDFDHSLYFAAKSNEELGQVCKFIQQKYALGDFLFDSEDNWEYGYSYNHRIGFNVTNTDDLDTISRWMTTAPSDVNYQIVLHYFKQDNDRLDIKGIM